MTKYTMNKDKIAAEITGSINSWLFSAANILHGPEFINKMHSEML